MKILITAPPKTGKSTLFNVVKNNFQKQNIKIAGMIADQIVDEEGKRKGFIARDIKTSKEVVLAHKTDLQSDEKIKNYSASSVSLDGLVGLTKRGVKDSDVVMIDEIGRMQNFSEKFMEFVVYLYYPDNKNFVISTIVYDHEEFARPFKDNPETIVLELTKENRNDMPNLIQTIFENKHYYYQLSLSQKKYVNTELEKYVKENDMIMANKLMKRSCWYATEKTFEKAGENEYILKSEHGERVIKNGKCSCDLFCSKGKYEKYKGGNCSHVQALRISQE